MTTDRLVFSPRFIYSFAVSQEFDMFTRGSITETDGRGACPVVLARPPEWPRESADTPFSIALRRPEDIVGIVGEVDPVFDPMPTTVTLQVPFSSPSGPFAAYNASVATSGRGTVVLWDTDVLLFR